MATYGLGIDLGGTKILGGVIDLDTGEVLSTAKKKTKSSQGAEELLSRLTDVAEETIKGAKLPNGAKVTSVGVAAAGQVDPAKGELIAAPNLGEVSNLKIGAVLKLSLIHI